jgi:peptidoglycan LD-endopeptidase CwlK
MPLGKASRARLSTCHIELQALIEAVAVGIDQGDLQYAGVQDIEVTCGHRGEADQNKAFKDKTSKVKWPKSKHNRVPSDAVDVVPYPERWSSERKLEILHAYIAGVAHAQGLDLFDIAWDRPHIERKAP